MLCIPPRLEKPPASLVLPVKMVPTVNQLTLAGNHGPIFSRLVAATNGITPRCLWHKDLWYKNAS
jgi:hypothetical protein